MFKHFIPFAHAKSIYEIDIQFFKSNNVKTLLVDLDNTLDSYKLYHPKEEAKELISNLLNSGIRVVIISNNKGKRVGSYANDLHLQFINSAMKPFPKKINKFIKEENLNRDEVMFVGDQMMTDVIAANKAKIRIVLTDKIVKEDQWTTHINRIFGRPIRRYHQRKGNLVDWRNKYGKA